MTMAETVMMAGSDVKPECALREELPQSSFCWWYFLRVGAVQALEAKGNDSCLSVIHPILGPKVIPSPQLRGSFR